MLTLLNIVLIGPQTHFIPCEHTETLGARGQANASIGMEEKALQGSHNNLFSKVR